MDFVIVSTFRIYFSERGIYTEAMVVGCMPVLGLSGGGEKGGGRLQPT